MDDNQTPSPMTPDAGGEEMTPMPAMPMEGGEGMPEEAAPIAPEPAMPAGEEGEAAA